MPARDRSISQQMRKKKSLEERLKLAQEWAEHWKNNQGAIVHRLCLAESRRDFEQISGNLAQLNAMTEKMFSALPQILDLLAEDGIDSTEQS